MKWITLEDQKAMALHKLSERTYLTVDGRATTDEAEANTLLGNAGDEILAEQAAALGLDQADDGAKKLTKAQLLERAAELGLEDVTSKMKVDDIRAAVEAAESTDTEPAAAGADPDSE